MSQLDTQTKTIKGHTFEVGKLDPLDAQDLLVDLGQVLAPALVKAAPGAAKVASGPQVNSLLDMDLDDPQIANAVGALFQGLNKTKLRELITTMAAVSWYIGTKGGKEPLTSVYKAVFRGDLALMYSWLWFALEVNFGNFFGWAGNAISGFTGIVRAAQSQSTSNATGQS